jgi:hypothetical protein
LLDAFLLHPLSADVAFSIVIYACLSLAYRHSTR